MTHQETSLQTKKMLCTSLKKIMKHKAFSKITVSELNELPRGKPSSIFRDYGTSVP